MTLGEKLRYLRLVEGNLRGLDRDMTQQEVVRAIRRELGQGISQSYLSQIENGARPHLTNNTRSLLSRFFKSKLNVGPGVVKVALVCATPPSTCANGVKRVLLRALNSGPARKL